MSKKMLINASHPEENRVAIVVDGILSELDIEIAGQEQTKGNIYKAVVVRVESGLQAAFVDFGAEKLGFLQIGEIHPNLYPSKDESKGRPRITDILQRGQEILVQIVKEERGSKGAALTTNLSIPGRYMVLMPDSTTKGVSRKIQDDPERKKLKRTMAELNLPERMGYIVRTAGIGKEKEELKRDFDYLVRLFEGIVSRKDQVKAPAHLYQESNLVIRSIRDYFSTEMDEVLIDDQKVYQETKDFFALVMPELTHLVKSHRERRPIFSRYQIEEQIDALAKNQIPMASGGSIVIDQTEALVAIDVNSGKMSSESGIEATAYKTNLEAAAEVGRQLRLRDLGGLVVIDFIDMRDRKNIRDVEHELRKALKDDKAKVTVGRLSQFGLMEMSRQRLKPTLSVGSYLECPHCLGKGRIKSAENQAVALLRQIHAAASKGHIGHIEASVPVEVANDMHNSKRQSLVDLEKRLNLKITIIGRSDMLPGQLDIELHKREKNGESSREIAPVSHDNQIENALAAAQLDEDTEQTKAEALPESSDTLVADNANPEATGEEETGERKSRRRRRRRRRKTDHPASGNTEQNEQKTSDEATPDGSTAQATEETPQAAEGTAEVKEQSTAEAESPKTAKESPRRRRSRRPAAKRNAEASSQQGEANATAEVDAAVEMTATTETAATEERPKRRPRRTRKPAVETPAGLTVATAENASAEETPTARSRSEKVAEVVPAETATAETPAAEKPKPRARRTKKVAETTATETTTAATETPTAEKPKPRARRTKKVAETTPFEATTATAETPAAEKPKPRARRTKKVAETTATETTTAATETAATETAAAEKPKPRARRTKKVAETTATETTTAATETAAAEKPKPRARRTKKVAETAATETTTATAETPAAEKPKPRARKTKKVAEAAPAEATATTGETPAAEKPKRRPGRPRKTAKPAEPQNQQDS